MARYKVSDLFYYFGFAIGAAVGYKGAIRFGVDNHIVALLISLGVGVGVGMLVERIHAGPGQPPMDGP